MNLTRGRLGLQETRRIRRFPSIALSLSQFHRIRRCFSHGGGLVGLSELVRSDHEFSRFIHGQLSTRVWTLIVMRLRWLRPEIGLLGGLGEWLTWRLWSELGCRISLLRGPRWRGMRRGKWGGWVSSRFGRWAVRHRLGLCEELPDALLLARRVLERIEGEWVIRLRLEMEVRLVALIVALLVHLYEPRDSYCVSGVSLYHIILATWQFIIQKVNQS